MTDPLPQLLHHWHQDHQAPGRLVFIPDPSDCPRVIHESFRWGEAHLEWQDDDFLRLGVALSVNQHLAGGVVLADIPVTEDTDAEALRGLRALGERLLNWLEERNAVNAALMKERRHRQQAERRRAEGIHAWKIEEAGHLRLGFAQLEPELVLAIRRGDRSEARRLLNALLISLYNAGANRLDRIKDLLAELIYLMRHAARDCGVGDHETSLLNEPVAEALAGMEDEEDLSPWVHRQLEGILDAIAGATVSPAELRARKVVDYIRENCGRPLGRAEVAQKAGLSEAEFSRMLKRETGASFTEHLTRNRIDQAVILLRTTPLTIQEIGYQCGFENPPHFSRTFKSITGKSPTELRSSLRTKGT